MLARMDIQTFASMGGKARAAKLSKDKLSEIGRKASIARWLKRTTLTQDVSKLTGNVNIADLNIKYQKCQVSHCRNPGSETIVSGMKAWLCDEHAKR